MMFSVFVVVLTVLTMNVAAKAAKDMAVLEVVLWDDPSDNGDYSTQTYTLEASFSVAGSKTSAEGNIVQMHPLGLCNNNDNDELVEYGWVGVVKLETPMSESQPCLSVFGKAKRALKRGATAVIFDVTDHPNAVEQLKKGAGSPLDRPVLLIHGESAYTLMNIISKQRIARARIHYTPAVLPQKNSSNEYFNMGIFMAFFVLVSLVCILLLLKIKWRQRRKQTSLTRLAVFAVSKMEVRKYQRPEGAGRRTSSVNDSWSINSDSSICAICLEEFKDGEELRVVSCSHEFHRHCVDPWLIKNRTCPLCLHNIIEYPSNASVLQSNSPNYQQSSSSRRRRFFNLRLPRRRPSSSSSLHSQNAMPQANLVCPTRPNNQTTIRAFMHHYPERNCTPDIQIARNNEPSRGEVVRGPTYCRCRSQLNLPNRHCSYCPHVVSNHRHYHHSNTYYEHHIDFIEHQQPRMVDEYQHRLVPVVVQLRTHEMSSSGYDGSVSNNMDASSSSNDSLPLTAPCKSEPEQDWSDHTNGSENIDSNQSVYGSSSTFRSDPQSTDPNVYSRRRSDPLENTSSHSADNLPPTRLTPSCMVRKKLPHDRKPHEKHIRNKNSHSMENVAGCNHDPKACEQKAASNLPNLRHTFTTKGQCTACSQLLRLPGRVQLKEQHRKDTHSRGRKGGRNSQQHHHHHHSPVRNTRNSSSQHFERQYEHVRKCQSSSRTNPMQSVVLYTNQSGQVLTVPTPSDQVNHLEEMV